MLLLGTIGWGLLAIGAITHVWHHERLRELLALHLDHERVPAALLTCAEVGLAVLLPVAYAVDAIPVLPVVAAASVLAVGFCFWIARLLLARSDLPCACSFSSAPTSLWSLARAVAALSVLGLAAGSSASTALTIATFAVGMAAAGAIFVLPDALAWPTASRAQLTRAQAHDPHRAETTR